jgi:hypothetical protein
MIKKDAARLDSLTVRLLRFRFLACDAVSLGEQFPMFRKGYGTWNVENCSPNDTASQTTRLKYSGNEIL